MAVVIETTLGDITVDLFLKERPKTCLNFIKLCKLKYYNYNLFHTIEQGFIAQTGDPTGAGDGGSSVWGVIEGNSKRFFESETIPKIKHSEPGLLSMVGSEDKLIGSQFFFTLGPDLISLDGTHCVIGEVTEGHDVLRKISEAICDENHRPYQDIRITHTVILEDPFSDPRGFREPSRSPSPSAERLKNGRIGADEEIDDTEGKTEEEIQEMLQEREAKARATILEIVGDIPDADIAPPENVLFVCKLNPVTTDDDLKIIFSRFGNIKSCEVIRDKQTGDSLQYSFIEFEDRKSCEDAYFKMDNVLIDDRRIHVDFSQSVSKIKWRGRGNYEILEDSNEFKSKKIFRNSKSRSPVRRGGGGGERRGGAGAGNRRSRSRNRQQSRSQEARKGSRQDDDNKSDPSRSQSLYDRGNWRNNYEKYYQWRNSRQSGNNRPERRPRSRSRSSRSRGSVPSRSQRSPPRHSRDSKDSRGSRNLRDQRDSRDSRDMRDSRDSRDIRDSRDSRDVRDSRDSRDVRDSRDTRMQESRRPEPRRKSPDVVVKTKHISRSRSRSPRHSKPKKQRKRSTSLESSASSSSSSSDDSSDSDAKKKKKSKKNKSKSKKKKSKKSKANSSDDESSDYSKKKSRKKSRK